MSKWLWFLYGVATGVYVAARYMDGTITGFLSDYRAGYREGLERWT